jgi:hypothetical protein
MVERKKSASRVRAPLSSPTSERGANKPLARGESSQIVYKKGLDKPRKIWYNKV